MIIMPGQLWAWAFKVGDGSWPFEVITQEARESFVFVINRLILQSGQQFIVIAMDDSGPAQVPGSDLPRYDEFGGVISWGNLELKRWHVAMHKETLFWIEHKYFEQAELISDVQSQRGATPVPAGDSGDNVGRDIDDAGLGLRADATRTSYVGLVGRSAAEEHWDHDVALVCHGDPAALSGRLGLDDG